MTGKPVITEPTLVSRHSRPRTPYEREGAAEAFDQLHKKYIEGVPGWQPPIPGMQFCVSHSF